jgi:hypothetical protein
MKTRKSPHIPLILSREHVDPERRIVLMGAAYQRADRPRYLSARIACNIGERPAFDLPTWVGLKEGANLVAHGFTVSWFKLDAMMMRTDGLPGSNELGFKRYQRFVQAALQAGYKIEWQRPPGQHYGDRASFERACTQVYELSQRYA